MNSIERQDLLQILDKDKITMYDVQRLVEYLGKWFQEGEGYGRWAAVGQAIAEDVENATRTVAGLNKTLLGIYTQIQDSINAAYEATEQKANTVYQQYKIMIDKVKGDIDALEKVQFPEIRLPYNWEEIIKMTDRLSNMSPEQRQVFYEVIDRYSVTKEQ